MQGQTIKQQHEGDFGSSVAVYGQHIAVRGVGNQEDYVFTYMLDQHTNTWINNGKHSVPGDWPYVSIQNDLMVATVKDNLVCGIVYKLTKYNNNNNNRSVETTIINKNANNKNKNKNKNRESVATSSNNNNNRNVATSSNYNYGDVVWKEFARLTTKGDPMTSRSQGYDAVSIDGQIIFTGRLDDRDDGVGKVFVHELSNYNN